MSTDDLMGYQAMASRALRGVMVEALEVAATKGLPGDHHFFIEFDTRNPGVHMSNELYARHPETMTIVLQHQFWDLEVSRHEFSVGLAFGGSRHSLTVPFGAVVSFADPSVNFGLQFESEKTPTPALIAVPVKAEPPTPSADDHDNNRGGNGSAEVVTLDAFRKK